jgi:hypothetical protein
MKKPKDVIKPAFPGVPVEEKIVMASRRVKYTDRGVIGKMRKYLNECIQKRKTPFVEDFALRLGVSYRTLLNWSKDEDKPNFSEWYEILNTIQKYDLKKKSLSGEYVSRIANLLLSAEHNVVERVKKEVTGEGGSPIQVESTLSPEARKTYSDEITKIFEKIYSKPEGK